MAESHTCDHCKKIIKEVMYVITAKDPTGGTFERQGTELHYDCIIPWREADK